MKRTVSGKTAMKSSESIAKELLEVLGYKVSEFHKKVIINGVEVSDVDIVAEKDGKLYAVEVKAGPADVSSIRQVYVNSRVLKMIPIIVSRGLADERAAELAKELNVDIISLSDQVLTSLDELYVTFRSALTDFFNDVLRFLLKCNTLSEGDLRILSHIALSGNIEEAARNYGVPLEEFVAEISNLRKKGVLPKGRYDYVLLLSKLMILLCSFLKNEMNRSF